MAAVAQLEKVSDCVWELPPSFKAGMRVPARFFATRELIERMDQGVYDQIANVACLPGVEKYVCCMPDGHWGYGFPIGGVAAVRVTDGVVSPGGIGFDINCGMRLVTTRLSFGDVQPRIQPLIDALFRSVPVGVGATGSVRLNRSEFTRILSEGARWCLAEGRATPGDLERTEAQGCMSDANPDKVSNKAIERGIDQLGTLGSGNHYLEVQVLRDSNIFDREAARRLGLFPDQVVVMYHCGSRGFGHQVASDYLERFLTLVKTKYPVYLPDRELACAPCASPEGEAYLAAMRCAINMAFANRQTILHEIRRAFTQVFGKTAEELGIRTLYDISHNTAKIEEQVVDGKKQRLLVHRKGSTRAYGPGFAELPEDLRGLGQPVIIGGSMETGSYLLLGSASASQTFYTTAHGAGRQMSRGQAKKLFNGRALQDQMRQRGIYVRSASYAGLAEEAGGAYKNVDEVVLSAEQAGLSSRVARFLPMGNIKG